jgi:hypothetical protein
MSAPKRAFGWDDEVVIEGEYSELQRALNTAVADVESAFASAAFADVESAFAGAALADAELESLSTFASEYEAEMSKVHALVAEYVARNPFASPVSNREEKFKALEKLSTSPNGLGLTMEQLTEVLCKPGEWMRLFRAWYKPFLASARVGRPHNPETRKIFDCWVAIGRPSLTTQALAKNFFGTAFSTARPEERKKMIDRCRMAVQRTLNLEAD